MSVPESSGHGWPYKLTLLPLATAARGVAQVWRALAKADADWSRQRKMAPFPLFRWGAAVGILVWTATGASPHTISDWFTANFPWLLIAGVLALGPEVVRVEFGGLKMELLRETREEVKALSQQINQLQVQQASANANTSVNQYFTPQAAAVAEVNADVKRGEATQAVAARDIDWATFLKAARAHRSVGPPTPQPGSAPSTDTEPGSTIE